MACGARSRPACRSRMPIRALEAFLKASGVAVMKPAQYMDKWRLDRNGVRPVPNVEVKKALGLPLETRHGAHLRFRRPDCGQREPRLSRLVRAVSVARVLAAVRQIRRLHRHARRLRSPWLSRGTVRPFDRSARARSGVPPAMDRADGSRAAAARHCGIVAAAKARGLKLAVASSSTQTWVTGNLEKFGLLRSVRRDLHARPCGGCEARSGALSARAGEARRRSGRSRLPSRILRTAFSRPSAQGSSASSCPTRLRSSCRWSWRTGG